MGATDRELAYFFNVSIVTIHNWKVAHPELLSSINEGKEIFDQRVEGSLYHKAMGYSYEATKLFMHEGEVIEHTYTEHVPPSDTAIIFWLKNRKPKDWRDRTEQSITNLTLNANANMSVAEAQDLFRQTRNASPSQLENQFKVIEGKVVNKEEAS